MFSLRPEGYKGPLVEVDVPNGSHLVSLWNHEELEPVVRDGKSYAPVDVAAFDAARLGTRLEGNVDCLAVLSGLLRVEADGELVTFEAPGAPEGSRIAVSAGNPSYAETPASFGTAGGRSSSTSTSAFARRSSSSSSSTRGARSSTSESSVCRWPSPGS